MTPPLILWRVFPWDQSSAPGAQFSPTYIAPGQRTGRFDLDDHPPVLYLAESAPHALGEALQGFRGRTIGPAHLRRHGFPLAIAPVEVAPAIAARLPDLNDPPTLARLGVRPDRLASHDRTVTQGIARALHTEGHAGFRWWSALTGEWHGTVLFTDRYAAAEVTVGPPRILTVGDPDLITAAQMLGMGG